MHHKPTIDPEANNKVHLVLVALLITLAILCFADRACGEDPVGFKMSCGVMTNHPQEQRACEAFWNALEKHPLLYHEKEATTHLWYVLAAGYVEGESNDLFREDDPQTIPSHQREDALFLHATATLCLDTLGGICFAVWLHGDMIEPVRLNATVDGMVAKSVAVYADWLELAGPIFRNLCPEQPCPEGLTYEARYQH